MRILLLGDYSGLHMNLAEGLLELGYDVKVASGGDLWKAFDRDIDLKQPERFKHPLFLLKLAKALPHLCGHDIVQFINPNPLTTNPIFNFFFIEFIRRFNKNIFLGANGMDHYYFEAAYNGKFKHSVFQVPELKNEEYINQLIIGQKNQHLINQNIKLANISSGISACAVGYYYAYQPYFTDKTRFIPLPINIDKYPFVNNISSKTKKISFFIGKMKGREKRKGIDIIESILNELQHQHPSSVAIKTVSSVPFNQYTEMMNSSHVLCDQMYAYNIGMNGLIAQSKGLIACGGADNDFYKLINEHDNKPIIDLNKPRQEVKDSLEELLANRNKTIEQAHASREYVVKHHNYIKVAQQYIDFWKNI